EGRAPQTNFFGDLHRLGRAVRRGRPDHHDGRRVRIDDRPTFSPYKRGTEDAAGSGRSGRNVRDICFAGRSSLTSCRIVALRMEAAKLDSRGAGQRRSRRDAAILAWFWATVSGAGSSAFHRPQGFARVRAGRTPCGRAVGAAYTFGVCGRRRLSEVTDSLDVVAGDWRTGDRIGRTDFPASSWSRLRHHRRVAPRKRRDE